LLAKIDAKDADWRLGKYEILEEIGRGGMGVIYRARQRHSKRIVALKRLLSYHGDSRETLERFRREAEAAASLDHPNVLPIYEVEEEEGLPFFTMKYAAGGSLQHRAPILKENPRECVRLMLKVTRAVSYAHGEGILHRDLKPGNILLDGRGEPMVSDFGLAKWLDRSTDLTRTLTVFGTPGYIAPEQAHAPAAQLTPAADTYSLGAVLFDLVAGRPPFLGEHALSVLKQAEEKAAPKLRSVVKSIDRDLEMICAKCLERDPKLRFRSASDLAEDLQRWLEGRPITTRRVLPPVRVWRWSKRNRKLAATIAACLLLACVAVVIELQNRASERAAAIALHSVIVEPFLDLDSAKYDGTLSNTIASALQTELARRGPAQVTAAPSERRSAGTPSAGAHGSDRARAVLQGTKRVRDGKLRFSLRLINAGDGKVLYKRIVEASRAELIGKASADHVYAVLNRRDMNAAEIAETDPAWCDPTTRELLIAGRAVEERRTLTDLNRSTELFQKAVNGQPTSAIAYASLGEAQAARAFFTGNKMDLTAAESSARSALQINPDAPQAHKTAAIVLSLSGRFSEAIDEAMQSLELSDELVDYRLINRIATSLRSLGHPEKALAWYLLTFKNDARPYDVFSLGDCYAELGDDAAAATQYGRAATLFPELPEGWMGLCRLALLRRDVATAEQVAATHSAHYGDFSLSKQMAAQLAFFSRDFSKARALYQELATEDPNGGGAFYGALSYQSALARIALANGDAVAAAKSLRDELQKEKQRLEIAPRHPEVLYRIGAIHSCLGETELAIASVAAAVDAGWLDYRSLDLDPRFDTLRSHHKYQDIVRTMITRVESLRRSVSADEVPQLEPTKQ
jgi:serine/threonine protein kinase/tetratricopeptide (TPR) repeat protein